MNRGKLRSVFQLLCWEGAFALAFEIWVGPVYLGGLAGELGVSIGLMSLLAAAPWIGSVGQVLGLWFLERVPSLKGYTLRVAIAARSLWLIPMFLAAFFTLRQRGWGEPFPVNAWFGVTAVVACLYALLATSSAAAWQSWTMGLVRPGFRGRFYGFRQRFVMGAVVLAHLVASYWVGWRPGGYYAGFAALALLTVLAATASTVLLARVPDLPVTQAPGFLQQLSEPLKNRAFLRVLVFGAAFHGAILVSASYFPYYLTKELSFPLRTVALWTLVLNVGALLAAGVWGRRIDRTQAPAKVAWLTALWMALAPLLYAFSGRQAVAVIGPFEYFLSGAAFSGYSLALSNMLFKVVPKERNMAYFSVFTAGCGLAGAIAAVLGGRLAVWFEPVGGFRALWFFATIARLSALCFFLRPLLPERPARLREALRLG